MEFGPTQETKWLVLLSLTSSLERFASTDSSERTPISTRHREELPAPMTTHPSNTLPDLKRKHLSPLALDVLSS